MEQPSSKQKKGRKVWQVILEAVLAIAFFGACMFIWKTVRPGVLKSVFAEEYPSETTEMPVGETDLPVTFSEYNGNIAYVSGNTPMPAPDPTPTPEPSPTPVPTKNPVYGDTLIAGDDSPIVMDIAIRLMELDYLDFEQPSESYTEGTADAVRAFQLRNG